MLISHLILSLGLSLNAQSSPPVVQRLTWKEVGATLGAELRKQESISRLLRCIGKLHESFTEREARTVMALEGTKAFIDREAFGFYDQWVDGVRGQELIDKIKNTRVKSNGIYKKVARMYEDALSRFTYPMPPLTLDREEVFRWRREKLLDGLEREIQGFRFKFGFEGKRMLLDLSHNGAIDLRYDVPEMMEETGQLKGKELFSKDDHWPDGRKVGNLEFPDLRFEVGELKVHFTTPEMMEITLRLEGQALYETFSTTIWRYAQSMSERRNQGDLDALLFDRFESHIKRDEKFKWMNVRRPFFYQAAPQPQVQIEKPKEPESEYEVD